MADEGQTQEGQAGETASDADSDLAEANAQAQLASREPLPEEAYTFQGFEAMDKASTGWLKAVATDEREHNTHRHASPRSRHTWTRREWLAKESRERTVKRITHDLYYPSPRVTPSPPYTQGQDRPRSGFWWHFWRGLLLKDPW